MATAAREVKPRHPSVFLQDFVDVARPVDEVARRLGGDGSWLAPLAVAAGGEGETLHVRVGPSAGDLVSRDVRIRLGQAIIHGDGVVVPLRWEDGRRPTLFPVLDGDLEVVSLGDGKTRLVLHASYRPPLEAIGRLLDHALLHRVAESTVRSFLQRVGESLERTEEGTLR